MKALFAASLSVSLAAIASGALAETPMASANAPLGPSFTCPAPRDPLAQLICQNPKLARLDLVFVQTYQAYRQQLPADGQKALRAESIEFGRGVRARCGIANAQATEESPAPASAPANAADCVQQAYERQRQVWAARLTGAAAQEANRPIEQHLVLQHDLQTLGLIPTNETVDGVFGPSTRTAIIAFQQTMGLPVTGLLDDEDAIALERQVSARTAQSAPPPAAVVAPAGQRSQWENFQGEALNLGVHAASSVTDAACTVALEVHDPEALERAARAYSAQNSNDAADEDESRLFRATLLFLRTQVSAKAVHALYSEQPQIDRCRFTADAFTEDVYGRAVRQPLFTFEFDRATYSKIVWERFNPANMPKIVLAFSYGAFAEERLRTLGGGANDSGQPAAPKTNPADSISPEPNPSPGSQIQNTPDE